MLLSAPQLIQTMSWACRYPGGHWCWVQCGCWGMSPGFPCVNKSNFFAHVLLFFLFKVILIHKKTWLFKWPLGLCFLFFSWHITPGAEKWLTMWLTLRSLCFMRYYLCIANSACHSLCKSTVSTVSDSPLPQPLQCTQCTVCTWSASGDCCQSAREDLCRARVLCWIWKELSQCSTLGSVLSRVCLCRVTLQPRSKWLS